MVFPRVTNEKVFQSPVYLARGIKPPFYDELFCGIKNTSVSPLFASRPLLTEKSTRRDSIVSLKGRHHLKGRHRRTVVPVITQCPTDPGCSCPLRSTGGASLGPNPSPDRPVARRLAGVTSSAGVVTGLCSRDSTLPS